MAQSTVTNQLRLYLIWHLTKYLHLNVFVDKTYQLTFFLEKMDVMICTVDTQGTCVLPYFLSIKLVEHSFYFLTFQEIFSSSNEHFRW